MRESKTITTDKGSERKDVDGLTHVRIYDEEGYMIDSIRGFNLTVELFDDKEREESED